MIKVIGGIFLTFCFYLTGLNAQEIAGHGWTASETRPRPSGTISLAVIGEDPSSPRFSSGTLTPAAVENKNAKEHMPPFPVSTPVKIHYPRKAILKGWEGQTVVAAEILPDGSVGRTALVESSGHEELDRAAREAIKTWKFETESEQDDIEPQYVDIPVTFKLENED